MSPVNQWDQRVVGTRNLAATAATIAVVGLGVATEPAYAAEAKPHAMSRQEANGLVFSRAEVREQLNPEAVAYYSNEYGVSRKEAIQRLTTQGVAPNLQASLGKALGDDLAGLFFDNETGEWVVQVADRESSAAAGGVLDRLGLDGYSSLDWVGYTESDVKETKLLLGDLLKEELSEYTETGSLGEGAESLDLNLPDTLGKEARSRVDAVVARVAAEQVGPPVEVRYVDPSRLNPDTTYGCSFPRCATMTGGVRIDIDQSGGLWSGCSAAFKGGASDLSSTPFNWLTAGHCVQEGTMDPSGDFFNSTGAWVHCSLDANGTSCTPTVGGNVVAGYFADNTGDAALLDTTGSGVGQPNVARWKGNQTNYFPVRGWYTQRPAVGTSACYSGRASGTGCGTVTVNNLTYSGRPPGYNFKGMMRIEGGTFCPVPGDSGGAVTGPTDFAMGIISRGLEGTCPTGTYAIVEPIHRAVDILGSEPIVTP